MTAVVAILKIGVTVKELENQTYLVSFDKMLVCFVILFAGCFVVCLSKVLKYGRIVRNMKQTFASNYYNILLY